MVEEGFEGRVARLPVCSCPPDSKRSPGWRLPRKSDTAVGLPARHLGRIDEAITDRGFMSSWLLRHVTIENASTPHESLQDLLGERIPRDHPLRPTRALVDLALEEAGSRFAELYARTG